MRRAPFARLVCCLLLTTTGALAGTPRLGWHGEPMPGGLEKAEVEGQYRWLRDGGLMVYVPAGAFPMGSADGDPDERPVHEVEVSGFYIDLHEVTWGQWKRSGLPYAEGSGDRRPRPEAPDWGIRDDHPMLDVTWHEARAWAAWAGKRLPTEAEWEKAARGTDGRVYPWGDAEPTFEHALWKDHPTAKTSTAPAISHPTGASPYGVLHMAGNVYEWCEDVYDRAVYARRAAGEASTVDPLIDDARGGDGRYRVLRGGAFVLDRSDLRSALRYRLLPEDRGPYIGFRTVVSAPAAVGTE